jgi:NADH pyrophosphatase NudC (nudix superfamily)
MKKPTIENLKAGIYLKNLTIYQQADAINELQGLVKYIDQLEAENKKLKEASSILNSLSEEKICPVCTNKMDYKPRIYHCNHCGSDFN